MITRSDALKIAEAVGAELPEEKIELLCMRLNEIDRKYSLRLTIRGMRANSTQQKQMDELKEAAKKFSKLVNAASADPWMLTRLQGSGALGGDIGILKAAIRPAEAIMFAAHLARPTEKIELQHTALEWLIGDAIPGVYGEVWGKALGISRPKDGGGPRGPGVQFLLRVAKRITGEERTAEAAVKIHQRYRRYGNGTLPVKK